MALELTLDLFDGNLARLTEAGWELDRIALITGVSGYDGYAKLVAATGVAGLPAIGDNHPYVTTAYLREMSLISMDTETVKLRLLYQDRWSDVSIEVGSSLVQVETNKDKDGEVLSVSYGSETDQSPMVSKMIATRTLIIRKRELFAPEDLARTYVGKVNSLTWRGDGSRKWMCNAINGGSQDGGAHWDNIYEFQFRDDTWDVEVVWFDSATGRPPDDADVTAVEIYETIDFNALDI